jgi:hypothetical protein
MAPAVYPSYNLVTIVYLWPPTLVYAEPNSVQQGAPCWPSPVSAGTLIYGKIVMNGQYAVCRLP